jgi:hypothetical protein
MTKDKWERLSIILEDLHKQFLPDLSGMVPWGWPYNMKDFEDDYKGAIEKSTSETHEGSEEEAL